MARGSCSVEGCGKPWYARGMCRAHYSRAKRYGDPTHPRPTNHGPSAKLIEMFAAGSFGDECVIWPMSRNADGYGKSRYNGVNVAAHRAICRIAHGEPPTAKHEAAHSCGNGKGGCVNPRHLRWATPKENSQDRSGHGTQRGELHPRAKLTESQVQEIRAHPNGHGRKLADKFGVSTATIAMVRTGRNWAWLK